MKRPQRHGAEEVKHAYGTVRRLFVWAAVFSFFVNILMLSSPIYMLNIYDRVLASKSVETLAALSIVIGGAFVIMGILDYIRGRILARAGARFQTVLDARVARASLQRALSPDERNRPNTAAQDLEAVQQFLSSPAPCAFFDAPWTPIYLIVLYMFDWRLGVFALGAGVVLSIIATINEMRTRGPDADHRQAAGAAQDLSQTMRREAEALRAMGMTGPGVTRWLTLRAEALTAQIRHSDRAGLWQTASKTLRMFIQSAILGLGAWLAVNEVISPGAMIAGSILMGRALAPIDLAINQWRLFLRARRGSQALKEFLAKTPPMPERTPLPQARGQFDVFELAVVPPGSRSPVVRGVSFSLDQGEALGIIGPSGGGKSSLARALVGIWPPASGEVRLDGATLAQWDETQLGAAVGYVPQEVGLFNGSIAENIARLASEPDSEKVIAAAQKAGAHEMILKLPDGYNTRVGATGTHLSGGQRQRVGLARAFYGEPAFLLLDEPNSNLDNDGEQALIGAIRRAKKSGCSVVVIAHRPSAIGVCDRLLMLRDGRQIAYGPRDEVLRQFTKNHGGPPPKPPAPSRGGPGPRGRPVKEPTP